MTRDIEQVEANELWQKTLNGQAIGCGVGLLLVLYVDFLPSLEWRRVALPAFAAFAAALLVGLQRRWVAAAALGVARAALTEVALLRPLRRSIGFLGADGDYGLISKLMGLVGLVLCGAAMISEGVTLAATLRAARGGRAPSG